MKRTSLLAIAMALIGIVTGAHASTLFRLEPAEYWTDYADYSNGGRIAGHAELLEGKVANALIGMGQEGENLKPVPLIFADVKQREWLVLDFGRKRPIGKVIIRTAFNDDPRVPDRVSIYGSNEGPDGPWTALVENGDMRCRNGYMLDNREFRWIRLDFGECTDGKGSRVKGLKVYKRYYNPSLAELMKAFYPKFRRDYPGLEEFWKKIDAQDWEGAASALRTFEEKRYEPSPNPPQYTPNALLALEDKIDFQNGVIVHYRQGIDWDFRPEGGLNNTERGWVHAHIAREYSSTGDVRYAKKLAEFMNTYLEQCPRPPETVSAKYDHWATLSIGGRCGHWAQILRIIVKDRENFSDELYLNILYSMWEQYDYLYHGGSEGGNWLAVVSGAVLGAGLQYQEFTDYKAWLDFGKSYFVTNVMRDVYPDGKEFENSDGYVAFAYGLLLGNYNNLKKSGVELPAEVHRRMRLGQDWSAWMLQPNMRSFMIGDSNGGAGSGLVLGTARQFDRPDLVYMATQGREGVKPSTSSRHFPISGWFSMRSDWDERPFDQARQLMMTVAPYGPHGHQDQLSISCYAYGRPLLSVPSRMGEFTYATPEHWGMIHTQSKNTVVVDGKPQPLGNDPSVKRRCDEMEWFGGRYLDLADAAHPMYEGVIHRRRVLFVRGDYWVVIDDLTPKPESDQNKSHTYDQHFHFKEGTDAVTMKDGIVRTDFKKGGNLMLIPLEPEKLAASKKTSTPVNYIGCDVFTMYGWKYSLEGVGHQRFVTVLYPYPTNKSPKVTVKKLDASPNVMAVEISTPSGRDIVYVGDEISDYTYSNKLSVKARVLVARLDTWGKPVKVSALDVKKLKIGAYSYSECEAVKSIEIDLQGVKPKVNICER